MTRHKDRKITVIEAEAKFVDVCVIVPHIVVILIRAVAHRENYHVRRCGRFFLVRHAPSHTSHADETEIQGEVSSVTIPFDYLIYAVGAETQTFGIPGVKEHACFMKEIQDAERVSPSLFQFDQG